MIKYITRKNVIKALETETLERGRFFTAKKPWDTPEVGCNVCAVGAVLRHMSFETWARKNDAPLYEVGIKACKTGAVGCYSGMEIPSHLKKRRYLAALSCYFESGRTKEECIEFVKKHFPWILILRINK